MQFHFDDLGSGHTIAAYGPGWIRVGDTRIECPCVITARELLTDVLPAAPAALTLEHAARLRALGPEIVLLGTGSRQLFPDAAVLRDFATAGVGCEVMDSGAACRSYNILHGEGRAVVAALFML